MLHVCDIVSSPVVQRSEKLSNVNIDVTEQESIAFSETFHRIRRDLIASEKNDEIAEALKWFDKVSLCARCLKSA